MTYSLSIYLSLSLDRTHASLFGGWRQSQQCVKSNNDDTERLTKKNAMSEDMDDLQSRKSVIVTGGKRMEISLVRGFQLD